MSNSGKQGQSGCCGSAAGGRSAGFTCLPNWLFGEATAQELVVLLTLQHHAPNIHPSLARLAKESGLGKSTVCRTLASLKARGWLETERRYGEEGRNAPTAYRLTIWSEVVASAVVPERDNPLIPVVPERDTPTQGPGLVVPEREGACPRAGHEEEELKNKRTKPLEPPLVPPVGGERRPSAVATGPCHDLGRQLEQASEPVEPQAPELQQAWPMPDRDRDGFLINPLAPPPAPAAAAPARPEPEPLPPVQPELIEPEVLQATQPQPQQPNPPWPLPEPPDPEAEAPVNPKGQKRKATGFQPVEGDVPAALLPVVRELLAFWASKGGKRTERAWSAQLGQLQRIQDDPAGGTEAVRTQLEAGAQAAVFGKAWMAVTHANWERYGKRVTPIIGSGFGGKRTTMDRVNGAIALVEEAERRAAAEAAQRSGLVLVEVA